MTADSSDAVWVVEDVTAEETRALRRFVLRRGTPTDNVTFDADDRPGTRHFVIRDADGAVIATSTWFEGDCPTAAGVRAVQLRAMAVHDDHQGRGLGAVLIDAGVTHAASLGAELVWAKARDSALGFYTSEGFDVVGDGFLTEDTRIPHHLVVRTL